MTAPFDIVVPALALRDANAAVDHQSTLRYARRAAATWVDYFILSGSTTRGQDLTPRQRADILDLWLTADCLCGDLCQLPAGGQNSVSFRG